MKVSDLEPSLTALLRAEREAPGIPADAQAALWARLETSVALPPPGHPTSRLGLDTARFAKGPALRSVLSGLGVAAGLAALVVVARPSDPAPVSSIERRQPPPSTAASEPMAPPPLPSSTARDDPAPVLPAPIPTPPHAVRPRPASDDDLRRERALIEAARAAIQAGAPAQGIDKLDEHARTFPRGRMSEERDALRVFALRASGHDAEATSATEEFRNRYPHSLLLGNR